MRQSQRERMKKSVDNCKYERKHEIYLLQTDGTVFFCVALNRNNVKQTILSFWYFFPAKKYRIQRNESLKGYVHIVQSRHWKHLSGRWNQNRWHKFKGIV